MAPNAYQCENNYGYEPEQNYPNASYASLYDRTKQPYVDTAIGPKTTIQFDNVFIKSDFKTWLAHNQHEAIILIRLYELGLLLQNRTDSFLEFYNNTTYITRTDIHQPYLNKYGKLVDSTSITCLDIFLSVVLFALNQIDSLVCDFKNTPYINLSHDHKRVYELVRAIFAACFRKETNNDYCPFDGNASASALNVNSTIYTKKTIELITCGLIRALISYANLVTAYSADKTALLHEILLTKVCC